jgi:formamidopyrimidine-DNA glycosylase
VPELPEVEVVRRGLARWVSGRRIADVEVRHPRAVRRHGPGAADFAARLRGRTLGEAARRGKYLWIPLDNPAGEAGTDAAADPVDEALVAHLGMSGQLLVRPPDAPDETHLRVRLRFADDPPPPDPAAAGYELRFVDQRTFGGLALVEMVGLGEDAVPLPVAHIARDPLDPRFDDDLFAAAVRRRRTGLKRALLDQSLVSGVGNIYADEALWRARLHYDRATDTMRRPQVDAVLGAARAVMLEALAVGGTSFDALYVDVNGQSGYFERSLDAYGRVGEPCRRCGTLIVREPFMNRSSYRCPHCQRAPRRRAAARALPA